MTSTPITRWETERTAEDWEAYKARFAKLFETGADVEGEARFLDAMLERGSAVMDAGCGTGRIAAALHRMGHRAVGVDKDAGLVEVAVGRYPGVPYVVADLYDVQSDKLSAAGAPTQYDVIALPGNVLVYVAPGTERQVLSNLAGLLLPGGALVVGFATDRDYTPTDLDVDARALGLTVEHRFATWQLEPFVPGSSGWIVAVLRSTPLA